METFRNLGSVAQQGAAGYEQGRAHARTATGMLQQFDRTMNQHNMDALAGRPHPHDIFVRRYARNQEAGMVQDYYRRTNPSMPGPRTALYYTNFYGLRIPGATGTEGQQALVAHIARQQEHIRALRNNPEPRGAYHNADPLASDQRPQLVEEPRQSMDEILDAMPTSRPTPDWVLENRQRGAEMGERMRADRRESLRRPALQMSNIPGAPRPASAIQLGSIMPTVSQDPQAVPRRRFGITGVQRMGDSRPSSAPAIEQAPQHHVLE